MLKTLGRGRGDLQKTAMTKYFFKNFADFKKNNVTLSFINRKRPFTFTREKLAD